MFVEFVFPIGLCPKQAMRSEEVGFRRELQGERG